MSPLEKLHFGKKSLGLWLVLTKKHGSLIRAFNASKIHKAYAHYPNEDILSNSDYLQYFYHSHRDTGEHGHIHIFSKANDTSTTNHLLAIGLSEKGLPISLFTVDPTSVNEERVEAKILEQLLSQTLQKTHKETLLTDWVIAFCTFYKNDIRSLFTDKNKNPKNNSCSNDIRELKFISWKEDLERAEKRASQH